MQTRSKLLSGVAAGVLAALLAANVAEAKTTKASADAQMQQQIDDLLAQVQF